MLASFSILLKKNVKLELRTWILTLIEILAIIVLYTIISLDPISGNSPYDVDEETVNTQIFNEHHLDNLDVFRKSLIKTEKKPTLLAYTPDSSENQIIISEAVKKLGLSKGMVYADEATMIDRFDKSKFLAAVVFDDENDIRLRFPAEFRTFKTHTYEFDNLWVSRCSGILNTGDEHEDTDLYIREGFLPLQHQLFEQWMIMNGYDVPEVTVKGFHQDTKAEICKQLGTSNLLLFLYSFTFFITYLRFIWQYGRERQKDILAHHWRYGIGYAKYWAAHCVVSFLHLLILDIIIIVLVKVPIGHGQFEESILLIIAYLLLHNIALLFSVIALVSIWSIALHAVLFGAAYWISMYAMFAILIQNITDWNIPQFLTAILFFNNSFEYGMQQLRQGHEDEDNDLMYPFIILAVCCLLAWIFIAIAEFFSPGEYIETKPFQLFGIIRLHNVMNKLHKEKNAKTVTFKKVLNWENVEYGPVNGAEYLRLQHVTVNSKNMKQKYVLKNVNLRVFSNEITVILGSHCSGKTTIIKTMAGWKRPYQGAVEVQHVNLYENWKSVRHFVDVNMPNNQLFDYLTTQEMIKYYIEIKLPGKNDRRTEMELNKWLNILKIMQIKPNTLVKKLTFDEKRLVMLCCTLSVDTKIILLDQPTLHMKAPYQRFYWEILVREKINRAIVLTTFDVREAEALADRIALLDEGSLVAYGTPFFMKSRFGFGIDLIILKTSSADTEKITALIDKFIPNVKPDNEIGDQVTYKLPIDMRPKFQHMLIHLEKDMKTLGIVDIRALSSEMSESFTILGSKKNKQVISFDRKEFSYVPAKKLGRQQSYALFYKKLIHQAPNFIPLLIIAISFLLILLLAYLAKPLYLQAVRDDKILLGDHNEIVQERSVDKSQEDCPMLEIRDLTKIIKDKGSINSMSLIFEEDKFDCHLEHSTFTESSKEAILNFGVAEHMMKANESQYVGWINQNLFHSAPLTLNLIHNLILEYGSFNESINSTVKITNHPLPVPLHTKINLLDQLKANLVLPMVLGVVVPLTIAGFITYLVEERIYHLLTLQKMAGLSLCKYWFVNYLWDFATFFSYTIVYVLILAISSIEGFSFSDKLMIFLLMNVYGIAGLATVYVLSLFFHKTLWSAYLIAVIVQVTTGIIFFIIYWDVTETNIIIFYIFSIFPAFSFMNAISNVYTETKEELYCDQKCRNDLDCNRKNICEVFPNCCFTFWDFFDFSGPGILGSILFMLLSAALLIILLTIIEKRRESNKFTSRKDVKKLRSATYSYDDKDVVTIKKSIAEQDYNSSIHKQLMVDQLEYTIPKTGTSVETISFEVDKGQCLGIYGTRHCGKSHVASQIIGEKGFAFGDIYVDGIEMKYNSTKARLLMSYVPQDRGYWDTFTPRELLRFFCMLRGIKMVDIRSIINDLSLSLNMGNYMDKKIRTLHVDRRRKVNIAVAIIAQHKIIVLDEPTRGLSPHTSREILNVLRFKRFTGKTIVFTSTDIIELEALSDRALVYNEGQMWAYGGTQYLRRRYTRGFYLDVKLNRDGKSVDEANENLRKDAENLQRFVTFLHEDSELHARYDNWFRFYCPVPNIIYSYLYGTMEKNKRRLNIADYAISQGTLDEAIEAIYKMRKQ